MTRSSFKFALAATLLLSPLLGGCAVAVVGGLAAAGGVGYEAAQERGVNGTFDDMNVQGRINNALNNQYGTITSTVYAGRVLLTGSSPNQQARAQAEQIARRAEGVRTVYDEIQVGPDADPWQTATDSWITARVRSDLVFNADVRSGNYTIETDRGSVYLIGSARSQAELDHATQLARYVPGVQRVVSYVEVRYGEPNGVPPGTGTASMPPPASGGGGYVPPPTSSFSPPPANAPIQVQKLQ